MQHLHLLGHPSAEHVRVDVHVPAPEVLPVAVGDLRTDDNPGTGCGLAHPAHRGLVAGMEPAGEVDAGDHGQEARVVG